MVALPVTVRLPPIATSATVVTLPVKVEVSSTKRTSVVRVPSKKPSFHWITDVPKSYVLVVLGRTTLDVTTRSFAGPKFSMLGPLPAVPSCV